MTHSWSGSASAWQIAHDASIPNLAEMIERGIWRAFRVEMAHIEANEALSRMGRPDIECDPSMAYAPARALFYRGRGEEVPRHLRAEMAHLEVAIELAAMLCDEDQAREETLAGYPLRRVKMAKSSEGMRVDGSLVFWALAEWSSFGHLHGTFARHGMEKLAPTRRTPLLRLNEALKVKYKPRLVRPLGGGMGYEVVEEHRAEVMNSYEHVVSVCLDGDDGDRLKFVGPPEGDLAELTAAYEAEADKVHSSALGKSLRRAVLEHFTGIGLKSGEAPYWVSNERRDAFLAFVADLEECGHSVFALEHERSERAVKAVIAALHAEIARGIEAMKAKEGGPKSRRNDAEKLRARITAFESLLAQELPVLKERVNVVEDELLAVALDECIDSPSLFSGVAS